MQLWLDVKCSNLMTLHVVSEGTKQKKSATAYVSVLDIQFGDVADPLGEADFGAHPLQLVETFLSVCPQNQP